jgi:hypothetical protein
MRHRGGGRIAEIADFYVYLYEETAGMPERWLKIRNERRGRR